jgi:uncharacterized protein YbjT (DUF2867 family)
MFLVMGITGKVGGSTAEHLLAHCKEVPAFVRNREKASVWANPPPRHRRKRDAHHQPAALRQTGDQGAGAGDAAPPSPGGLTATAGRSQARWKGAVPPLRAALR